MTYTAHSLFLHIDNTKITRKDSQGTGRTRFRGVRFQTPNSVSFLGLTEFRGASSLSSFQPILCGPKRTHRVFSQNSPSLPQNSVRLSEFSSPKQYSRNSIPPVSYMKQLFGRQRPLPKTYVFHQNELFSPKVLDLDCFGDFFSGCIVEGIPGIHANSDDFPWKNPQQPIIIRVFRPFVLIMMGLCGFFQGKSSEFA